MHVRGGMNLICWYGSAFRTCTIFESEVPAYPGKWFRPLARCRVWDSRDWYEFDF